MYRLRRLFSAGGMVRPLLRLADGPDGVGGGSVARVRASAGFKARRLRVGMLGAVIEVRGAMGYGQELASALAGPLANLLAAAILGRMRCTTAAGANGVLCAFNLLPVRPLDGGRALYLLLAWLAGPGTAEWGCRWVGISTALAAASGTAWLVWRTGGSLWLLPAVVGLLLAGAGWRDDR